MSELELIVLKINNKDVSYVQKEDILQMFLSFEEPFILEVRRKSKTISNSSIMNISEKLESMQMCHQNENLMKKPNLELQKKVSFNQIILKMDNTMMISTSNKETQTDRFFVEEHVAVDKIVEAEHNIFEQCLEPEFDVEEITLRKSNSNEQLGLTVCYSPIFGNNGTIVNINIGSKNTDEIIDQCTEVYISNIHPKSVAGRDGRLRLGDQILQVNGKDIKSKEDTEALIAENNNAVTLLISRYLYGGNDFFNDGFSAAEINEVEDYLEQEDQNGEDGNAYIASENKFRRRKSFSSTNMVYYPENNILSLDSNDKFPIESNNHNIMNSVCNQETVNCSSTMASPIALQNNSMEKKAKPCLRNSCKEIEHIYETIPDFSDSEPFYSSPYELHSPGLSKSPTIWNVSNTKSTEQQKQRVARWLGLKNHICDHSIPKPKGFLNFRFIEEHGVRFNEFEMGASRFNSSISNNLEDTDTFIKTIDDFDNSSSAYNSGGSNNSVLPCSLPGIATLASTAASTIQFPLSNLDSEKNHPNLRKPKDSFTTYKGKTSDRSKSPLERDPTQKKVTTNLQQSIFIDSGTIYDSKTNNVQQFTAPNLSQYHFVSSQEVCSILNSSSNKSGSLTIENPVNYNAAKAPIQEQMVWKVKRRGDGTRYIVKRPVRNYILKEKTIHLQGTPCDGTTTEDDTISEVKMGRYWSKEERKKHIEKARERRQQSQRIHEASTILLKPSFRKRSTKSTMQQVDSSNFLDPDANLSNFSVNPLIDCNQKRYFKLHFNSKISSEFDEMTEEKRKNENLKDLDCKNGHGVFEATTTTSANS